MSAGEISSKKKWEKAHKILNQALAKEVHLMREVLSNLHQEELALLEKNQSKWKKVMRSRSDLVLDLGKQRMDRMKATVELTKCCIILNREEMLPHDEESSCEILSKLDQIFALLDRTNLQNCRNAALFDEQKEQKNHSLQCPFPHPLHKTRKKTRVATYPISG